MARRLLYGGCSVSLLGAGFILSTNTYNNNNNNNNNNYDEFVGSNEMKDDDHLKFTFPIVDDNNLKLIGVYFCMRHGDRTPVFMLEKDKELNFWQKQIKNTQYSIQWDVLSKQLGDNLLQIIDDDNSINAPNNTFDQRNDYEGQLTERGKAQSSLLGHAFYKRYGNLLNLTPNNMKINSTNMRRTIATAFSFFNAIYPKDILHLYVSSEQSNEKILAHWNCKRLRWLIRHVMSLDSLNIDENKMEPLRHHIIKELNLEEKVGSRIGWTRISDNIKCRTSYGLPLPSILTNEDGQKIMNHNLRKWDEMFSYNPLTRLAIGPYLTQQVLPTLKNLTKHEQSLVPSQVSNKCIIDSCHDTTIIFMLKTFDGDSFLRLRKWPPYNSWFLYEVYEDKQGDHYVRLIHNNRILTLPNSDTQIAPFKKLEEVIEDTKLHEPFEAFCNKVPNTDPDIKFTYP